MRFSLSPLIFMLVLGLLGMASASAVRWRWYYRGSGSSGRGWSPVRRTTNLTCDFPSMGCDKACDRLGEDLIGCCLSPPPSRVSHHGHHGHRNHNPPGSPNKNKTKNLAVAKGNSSATKTTTTMTITTTTTPTSLPVVIPRGDADDNLYVNSSGTTTTMATTTTTSLPAVLPTADHHDDLPELCYCCKIPANQIKYYPVDQDYEIGGSGRRKIIKNNIHPPKNCKGCKVVEITSLRFTFHETEKEKEIRRHLEEMNI